MRAIPNRWVRNRLWHAACLMFARYEQAHCRHSRGRRVEPHALPASLHQICGRPLIHYPVNLARALGARVIVVVGRGADDVRAAVSREGEATFVEQRERRGTGHAVLQAREACGDDSDAILVLPGDMPLVSETTLRRLVERHRETSATIPRATAG